MGRRGGGGCSVLGERGVYPGCLSCLVLNSENAPCCHVYILLLRLSPRDKEDLDQIDLYHESMINITQVDYRYVSLHAAWKVS